MWNVNIPILGNVDVQTDKFRMNQPTLFSDFSHSVYTDTLYFPSRKKWAKDINREVTCAVQFYVILAQLRVF